MKIKFFKRLTACAVALITLAAMLPLNAAAANPEVNYDKYRWNEFTSTVDTTSH